LVGTDYRGTTALGGNPYAGITLDGAPRNVVGGTSPGAGNIASGNAGPGILIYDQHSLGTADNNVVEGNFVGTNLTGTSALGNAGDGVLVESGAYNNTIGGTKARDCNVISGNASDGVEIAGTSTADNVVEGNDIGTDTTGALALGNRGSGVNLETASVNSILDNTISGNAAAGVYVGGNGAPSGALRWYKAEGNAVDAVSGYNGTPQGGATYGTGEFGQAFSLNGSSAYVQAPQSSLWGFGTNDFAIDLWVNFNSVPSSDIGHPGDVFIGEDQGGGTTSKWFFALGGGVLNFHINNPGVGSGFFVQAPFSPTLHQWYNLAVTRRAGTFTIYVNGTAVGSQFTSQAIPDPNVPITIGQAEGLGYVNGLIDEVSVYSRALSAGEVQSVYRLAGAAQGGATIQGNVIGTNAAGTAALGNGGDGVTISSAAGNTVGGTANRSGNTIAFNGKGVVLTGNSSTGDSILGNRIWGNAGPGIDLGDDGATPNGANPRAFPNDGQNTPVITALTLSSVSGTLKGVPKTRFRMEFYASPGNGPASQGQIFLGFLNVSTNAAGSVSFTAPIATLPLGCVVTATATNLSTGDTSEFSPVGTQLLILSYPVMQFSTAPQVVWLTAQLFSGNGPVTGGKVTFTIPGLSGKVTGTVNANGLVTVRYVVPGGKLPGQYTIFASFAGMADIVGTTADTLLTIAQPFPLFARRYAR
jgi:titin